MINTQKLDRELKDAGVPIHGCNSDGEIAFTDAATYAHKKKAAKILFDHDPSDTRAQRLAKIGMSEFHAAMLLVIGDPKPPPDALAMLAEMAAKVRQAW